MKPRPPATLTEEDRVIWRRMLFVIGDGDHWCGADFLNSYAMARAHDRRDADLMFWAQRSRSYTFPVDLPPLMYIGLRDPIDCGGALAEWKTLNISYFA
jgi:hypothetical protein